MKLITFSEYDNIYSYILYIIDENGKHRILNPNYPFEDE